MKANDGFESGSGGESDELRALLRQWNVPGPPEEIEADLLRAFRKRRSGSRRIVWLAVAASLVLVLVHPPWPSRRPVPPRVAERPPVATLLAPPALEPDPLAPAPTLAPRARVPRPSAPAPAADYIVVEHGQGELLVELAREWSRMRQAAPGVSLPRIEVVPADAPVRPILEAEMKEAVLPYQPRWETVGSEWPLVQWSH